MIGKQRVDSATDLDREFIKADEFLSGFEYTDNNTRDKPKTKQTADGIKYPFKPIDSQTANEIQKIMYGDITVNNLDNPKLETNLSHSEQRMMLYILQQLEEQKQKQEKKEDIKEEDKIKEIVMFTGRKCCPVCHEALPKFMEHIKTNYGNLLPENLKITVYDFWDRRDYDGDFKNRDYLRNNTIITNPTDADYEQNVNNYYTYGSDEGVNYKSVFDENLTEIEKQHLVEFVKEINNTREYILTKVFNEQTGKKDKDAVLIGNSQYTVESLKGDSNVPIVFSIEELEQYNSIKTPVEEIKKLVDNLKTNIEALNSSLKKLEHNGEKIDIIRQALDMEKNQLPAHDDTKSQSQFFGEQSEKNTQDKTQLETATQIDETTQALAIKIKNLRDSLNEIKNQYIALKNNIIESEQFKEENINNIISKQQEKFEKNSIRYKQNSIALETLQDRQNGRNFVLQDYLKKTFAIDGITATVHEAQTTLNNLNNISNLQNSKGTVLASTCV